MKPKYMLIIGNIGCGKTTRALEEAKDYNVLRVRYEDLKTHVDLIDHVENFVNFKSISNFFDKREKLLLFDDIDILISQNRSACSYISSIIQNKTCNVIVTCITSQEKKLMDIKKSVVDIVYLDSKLKKDQSYYDNNIYDNVLEYLQNPERDLKELSNLLTSDIILVTFIIYDNYYVFINNNYKIDIDLFISCIVNDVTDIYCIASELEYVGFETNDWQLIEYAAIVKAYKLQLLQRGIMKYKKTKIYKKEDSKISYTQITSRTAQECNMKKKINSLDFLNYDNIRTYANIHHNNNPKKKLGHKTLFNSLCSIYLSNMCE
jgi:hypothetical protein